MCSTRRAAFLILALLLYLFLRGIGDHGLLDPLEGINASVSLNMVARQNLTVPLVENLPYLGKTMGFWWLNTFALLLFGWLEFSVRFWPAAAAVGMAAASWFIARRMRDERAANYAAVITGTSLLTYVTSQLASPHSLYACFVSLALLGIIYSFQDKRFFLLLHTSAMLAFIVYGPAGALLPWLCLLLYAYLVQQERFFLDALLYWPGFLATLLLGGGYLFLLHIKNPTLLTLMRYNPPGLVFGSVYQSLLLSSVAFIPWIGFVPEVVKNALPRNWDFILPSQRQDVLLLLWAAVFLFFGIFSGDGLILVAAVPSLASLCAVWASKAIDENNIKFFQRAILFEILFFIPFLFAGLPWIYSRNSGVLGKTLLSVIPWAGFCFLFLFAGWYYAKTRQPRKLMLHLSVVSLLCLLPLAGAFDLLADETSLRSVGLYLRENLERDDVPIQYALNRPSLFFYTARESLLFNAPVIPGVMARSVLNEPLLQQKWKEPRRIFMVLGRRQEITAPLPQEVYNLYEAQNLVVLSNQRDQQKIVGAPEKSIKE